MYFQSEYQSNISDMDSSERLSLPLASTTPVNMTIPDENNPHPPTPPVRFEFAPIPDAAAELLKTLDENIVSKRLLAARDVYDSLIRMLEEENSEGLTVTDEDRAGIQQQMKDRSSEIEKMLVRSDKTKQVIASGLFTDGSEEPPSEENWLLGANLFGTRTWYKEADSGLISVLIRGNQKEIPIFEQLCVVHEVDMWNEFVPFCVQSELVSNVGHAELVAYVNLSVKLISRDCCIHAYGVDCLQEHSRIVLVGGSVDGWQGLPIPFQESGWFHQTMECKEFSAVIEINGPNSATTTIIGVIDPKVALPQIVVNYAIKKLAGLILYILLKQANYVAKHADCVHRKRIKENKAFYRDWLLPKIENLCRLKGWEIPDISHLGFSS